MAIDVESLTFRYTRVETPTGENTYEVSTVLPTGIRVAYSHTAVVRDLLATRHVVVNPHAEFEKLCYDAVVDHIASLK